MNKVFSMALKQTAAALTVSLLLTAGVSAAGLDAVYRDVVKGTRADVIEARASVTDASRTMRAESAAAAAAKHKNAALKSEIDALEKQVLAANERLIEKRADVKRERDTMTAVFESVERHEILVRDLALPHGLAAYYDAGDFGKNAMSLERIRRLWLNQSAQIAATARVDRVKARIFETDGTPREATVLRIGPFGAKTIEGGEWLEFLPASKTWRVFEKQPGAFPAGAMPVDPTFGAEMAVAADKGSLWLKLKPAGIIGVFIGLVAVIALLLGGWRYAILQKIGAAVNRQRKNPGQPLADNPLGRLLLAAKDGSDEAIDAKLDAALTAEMPILEKGVGTLAVLAGIPTLLGLLGTVSGMIETFTVMSDYGNNQPDLLAGGIAEALVTTELGLIAAIPILLLHCAVKNKMKAIGNTLEEEAAGLAALEALKAEGEDEPLQKAERV